MKPLKDRSVFEIPLIVVTGTNASGKSGLGIRLAEKYNGEIISADSRQIFKGFDLCCGKVTQEERNIVPHHMLDVADIGTHYSVSDYQTEVYELMKEIDSRGKRPFLVGGTGLYVDAVVKGYDFKSEKADFDSRKELEKKSVEELQAMLSPRAREILSQNRSDFHNKRRLERIIEKEEKGVALSSENRPLHHVLEIGVTWPKELLAARIEKRLQKRLEEGMLNEVREYLDQGGDPKALDALGLEYRYINWYWEGKFQDLETFSDELEKAIRHFARQQMKWFRRNPDIHWIDMTDHPFEEACTLIDSFLAGMKAAEKTADKTTDITAD